MFLCKDCIEDDCGKGSWPIFGPTFSIGTCERCYKVFVTTQDIDLL